MALIYAVEDDKNILEIEMFALKNSGYQVEGFECAKDFYKKLDEQNKFYNYEELVYQLNQKKLHIRYLQLKDVQLQPYEREFDVYDLF